MNGISKTENIITVDSIKTHFLVLKSKNNTQITDLAIFLSGDGKGGATKKTYIDLARNLVSKNRAVLLLDFIGKGKSGGTDDLLTIDFCLNQLDQAVNYFISTFNNNHSCKLLIYGSSLGGLVGLLYSYRTELLIKCMALKAPALDYAMVYSNRLGIDGLIDWKTNKTDRRRGRTYQHYKEVASINVFIPNKISWPTLILHGKEDSIVPITLSFRLQSLNEDYVSLDIIENVGHMFEGKSTSTNNKLIQFLKNNC